MGSSWVMSPNLCSVRRPIEFFLPTASAFTFADATTWSGAQGTTPSNQNAGFNTSVGCTKFRAVVLIKDFTVGTSTGNNQPYMTLEVADTAAMTLNRCIVDIKPIMLRDINQTGVQTGTQHHLYLEGQLLNTSKQFVAVFYRSATPNANFAGITAITFDGWIDANI